MRPQHTPVRIWLDYNIISNFILKKNKEDYNSHCEWLYDVGSLPTY